MSTDDKASDEEEEEAALPDKIDVEGLTAGPSLSVKPLPKPTAQPKKRTKKVFIEPGYSQLDWAKLKRSGEVDLRRGVDSIQRITPRQLARHKTKDDCWQAYNGKVYDVTYFLKYHPGGVPEMMRSAGKDGTNLFSRSTHCLATLLQR